jgi:hypothetical protein
MQQLVNAMKNGMHSSGPVLLLLLLASLRSGLLLLGIWKLLLDDMPYVARTAVHMTHMQHTMVAIMTCL